jgi:ABC-type multidrug transport system fused ATPase/permease subunit
VASAAVLLFRSAIPAGMALTTGELISRSLLVQSGSGRGIGAIALPLASFALLLLAGQAMEAAADPLRYYVIRCMDGAHRRAVERYACEPAGIGHLEDAAYQDDLLLAAGDPGDWTESTPGQAAWAQLVVVSRYLSAALAIAVIARDSPPVAGFLLGALLVFRSVQRRGFLGVVRAWASGRPDKRRAEYWNSLLTGIAAAKEIRVFGFSGWAGQNFRSACEAHLRPFRAAKLADARRQWVGSVIALAAITASIFALAGLAAQGRVSAGHLGGDLTAVSSLLPMFGVSDTMVDIEAGLPRLLALLRLRAGCRRPPRQACAEVAAPWPGFTAGRPPLVRFEDVWFSYPGSGDPVLAGLNLDIRPGEVLGIVGLNGAGKTTLIKQLAALYEPGAGRVTADGTDLRDIGAVRWRRQLSVVFQDFLRYELSVRENIALGNAGQAGEDAILAAARKAGVTRLVEGLPAGWDTPLSPGISGGVDLSGGQWQRIAIARALLALHTGARLLVLDEPTAHLDVSTEFEVFGQVIEAAKDASVVLISHRLSTVRTADRIVLLADGRVAECGDHETLLAMEGGYARLFRLQARQFSQAGTA